MAFDSGSAYLDLLMRTLTRFELGDEHHTAVAGNPVTRAVLAAASTAFRRRGIRLTRVVPFDPRLRAEGRDRPLHAETMIGLRRLENLRDCISTVVADQVDGDVLEAGVWRGGAAIFARAALDVLGGGERTVWVADSFEGLPRPAPGAVDDTGVRYWEIDDLAVGVEQVKANFERYGLLDDRVQFLKGWFADTLPLAPIDKLAILRADGDMYTSTIEILEPLYDKVQPGGFVIVDDYGCVPACRQAVDDFRRHRGITEPLTRIDWTGVYWRRSHEA
jgi:O-methyltransferase